ncbi:hypothetical protein ACLOJK_025170 [Asimina triloba]
MALGFACLTNPTSCRPTEDFKKRVGDIHTHVSHGRKISLFLFAFLHIYTSTRALRSLRSHPSLFSPPQPKEEYQQG